MTATELYACIYCGSLSIEAEHWVGLNRMDVRNQAGDTYWCARCQEHSRHCLILQREGLGFTCDDDPVRGGIGTLREVLRRCCPSRPRWPVMSKNTPAWLAEQEASDRD